MTHGDWVIDAGANIGYFALQFANLVGAEGTVHAFEPLPVLANALQASVVENGFETRLHLHRVALDEHAGTTYLRYAPRTANFGGAHLAGDATAPIAHTSLAVTTMRLDDISADRRCRFIKLDVEGAEPRVIRGGLRLLRSDRPLILTELHNVQLQRVSTCTASDFIAYMAGLDYRGRLLNADGTLGRRIARYEDNKPINVVFAPT